MDSVSRDNNRQININSKLLGLYLEFAQNPIVYKNLIFHLNQAIKIIEKCIKQEEDISIYIK